MTQNKDSLTPYKQALIPPGISVPIKENLLIGILKDNRFIDFVSDADQLKIQNIGGNDFVIIGYDSGIAIAINCKTDGVYCVDLEGEYMTTFVNSNLKKLTVCLLLYKEYSPQITESNDVSIVGILNELKGKFEIIDEKVFDNPNNWWSVIFEQVEQGLL